MLKNLYSRFWNLNNSTSLTPLAYSPPDDLGGADFDDDDNGPILESNTGGDDDLDITDMLGDIGDEEGIEDDPEIKDDGGDFLAQFYKKGKDEKDDENDEEDEDAGDSPEAQQALATEIKNGIAALSIPESAIPDDFDPSNRKQLVALLATVQKDTVQQTMRIMWNPIAAALKQTHVRMRQEWKAGIGDGVTGSQRSQLLDQLIPNHGDPGVSDVVATLMARAKKRFPDSVRNQVLSTRKAMQSLGMKVGKSSASSGKGQQNRGSRGRTGNILDNFAKLPAAAFGDPNRPTNRIGNRLKK